MRNILITILTAIVVSIGLYYAFQQDYVSFSILIGVFVAIVVFIILTRNASKELEALNTKAQKALQAQKYDRALRIYESGLPLGKKSPFIVGQIYGMIGMLHYIQKNNDKAKDALAKASSMNWVAKGMLGVIFMHEKKIPKMEKVFREMVTTGKKEGLAWSLYAYCLDKLRRKDDAIKVLEEGHKKMKETDDRIKNNILELKNGRKMRMKGYGDIWYQFMLERPKKMMMQQQPGRGNQSYKKNAVYKG